MGLHQIPNKHLTIASNPMHICHYLTPLVKQMPKRILVEQKGRREARGGAEVQEIESSEIWRLLWQRNAALR